MNSNLHKKGTDFCVLWKSIAQLTLAAWCVVVFSNSSMEAKDENGDSLTILDVAVNQDDDPSKAADIVRRFTDCHPSKPLDASKIEVVSSNLETFISRLSEVSREQDIWGKGFRFKLDGLDPKLAVSYDWPIQVRLQPYTSDIGRLNGFMIAYEHDAIVLCSPVRAGERYQVSNALRQRSKIMTSVMWESVPDELCHIVQKVLHLHRQRREIKWDQSGHFEVVASNFSGVIAKSNEKEVMVIEKIASDRPRTRTYLFPIKQAVLIAEGRFQELSTALHATDSFDSVSPFDP